MTATINASTTAGVVTTADTSGILQLQTNGTAALTVDASQNVGIGTASPTAKLHVAGTIRATSGGATTSAVTVTQGYINGDISSSNFSIGNYGDSSSEMRIDTRGFTTFYTGATNNATGSERARIDSSGNLLVGTTSTPPNPGIVIEPTGRINIGRSNDDAVAEFYRSGTRVGQINVTTTATLYITSSDYRLKNTVAPITGALAKVALLKPCTYKWNVNGSDGQGFIAHELQAVCPSAVTGEKDAVQEEQYEVTPAVKDEEGRVITEAVMGTRTVPSYQGIDTSFLVATLSAAIQELHALVKTQDSTITALTTRITALEGAAA